MSGWSWVWKIEELSHLISSPHVEFTEEWVKAGWATRATIIKLIQTL
jgi:hypothetical protein